MTASTGQRDERIVLVETASFRWGYLVLSFGLLALVVYRSLAWRESFWDLLLLVVVGGAVPAAYQGYHEALTSGWAVRMLAAAVIGAIVAMVLALIA